MAKKRNTQERYSAVARSAEYQAFQQEIRCPFGKAFKTGGHTTGKKDISRKRARQNLKRELAY